MAGASHWLMAAEEQALRVSNEARRTTREAGLATRVGVWCTRWSSRLCFFERQRGLSVQYRAFMKSKQLPALWGRLPELSNSLTRKIAKSQAIASDKQGY